MGVASCALIPLPATRSMASLGLTYSFMPANESPAANSRKSTKLKKMIIASDLDVRDLLHDQKADDLQQHRDAQHDVADVVQKEELHIVRIGVEHENRHANWNASQRDSGHAPVR